MANLCIIPARGGSKRIVRKNIKLFLGKPIIAYSIEAAITSGLFDEVMVSTDDAEIAEIAIRYGAKVPFMRTDATANDSSTTFDVVQEVLLKYKALHKNFEYTCCFYACAPFVTDVKLIAGLELLRNNNFDTVFPVMAFGFPIQRALKMGENNKIDPFYPEYNVVRSQDLEQSYHDAGQFYWMNTEKCLQEGKIITGNTGAILISEMEGQDIDNEIDWKLAELKYKVRQE